MVQLDKIRKWVEDTSKTQVYIESKIATFTKENAKVKAHAEMEEHVMETSIRPLLLPLHALSLDPILEGQRKGAQVLLDASTQMDLQGLDSHSPQVLGLVEEAEKTTQTHKIGVLKEMAERDALLVDAMQMCAHAKNQLNVYLKERLMSIAKAQNLVSSLGRRLAGFRESVLNVGHMASHLEAVRRLPVSYAQAKVELQRRAEYKKTYYDRLEEFANEMAVLRAQEIQHREAFKEDHGKYLPVGLIHGLHDWSLPPVDLKQADFDEGLGASLGSISSSSVSKSELTSL